MTFSEKCNKIFDACITYYHTIDSVKTEHKNPYELHSIEYLLFLKNWIDTIQWHLEDIIRNPSIDPLEALRIKRRIDNSNQERTDLVERIDDYFKEQVAHVTPLSGAGINTETPAWAIDRLSILALKIFHMNVEAIREDAPEEHRNKCRHKLNVLLEQRTDLSSAIDYLLDDLAAGRKQMKLYKQMKMYNDPNLNPVLYNKGEQ
jgi:hypothetical protein